MAILVLIGLLCLSAFVGGRMVAQPELGAPVQGPSHGATEREIATWVASQVAPRFLSDTHADVVLSEQDLTVLARAHNPDPRRFSDPEVRVRDSTILLSAATTVGPFRVTAVAHITLSLSLTGGVAHIETDITEVDSGRQPVPDLLRSFVDPHGGTALAIDAVFNASPSLQALRESLDCVFIDSEGLNQGVHLGFHRPGTAPDPGDCVGAGAPVIAPAT